MVIPKVFYLNFLGMELRINHKSRFFELLPSSLEELIFSEMSEKTRGIAVAINNQVIPQHAWATTLLSNNDSILIISATQGG